MRTDQNREITTIAEAKDAVAELNRTIELQKQEILALKKSLEHAEAWQWHTIPQESIPQESIPQESIPQGTLQRLYNGLLLETYPYMLFVFDTEQRLILHSHACEGLLKEGIEDEPAGGPFMEIFHRHVDAGWIETMYHLNKEVIFSHEPISLHKNIEIKTLPLIYAHIQITPLLDENGAVVGSAMLIQDVTELTVAKRQAEEAGFAKNSFFNNIGYEIRTPMNAIRGLSELLSMTELDSLQSNYVHNIISSSNSLISIINDVLDISKINMNKTIILEGEYDVANMLEETAHVLGMHAEEKSLLPIMDVSPSIPSILNGDEKRIRRVINSLLSNAVKFTEKGFVKLHLSMEEIDGVSWLYCAVSDSGTGIREEDIPRLFETWAREDFDHTHLGGTGLGLAICKQLVHAMDGEIMAESRYGEGSTFSFRIPQDVVDAQPIAAVHTPETKRVLILGGQMLVDNIANMLDGLHVAHNCLYEDETLDVLGNLEFTHCLYDISYYGQPMEEIRKALPDCAFAALAGMGTKAPPANAGEAMLFTPLHGVELAGFINSDTVEIPDGLKNKAGSTNVFTLDNTKLLVVDDNEINLMVSSEMLRLFGAEVLMAHDGEEALRICENKTFDVIFLDHIMPGVDGLEVTELLREKEGPNQNTPIVALTANVDSGNSLEYYVQAGMNDFIAKPFEFADLARILLRWLPQENIHMEGPMDG